MQSLPLSGCSHGNHQVSRQAWKARRGTCDSLHMLRQSTHPQITGGELPPLFKLASTPCSHKKAMFGESESRQADDQSASPSVYHSLCLSLSVTHAHTYTHTHTNTHTVLWSAEEEEEAALEGGN